MQGSKRRQATYHSSLSLWTAMLAPLVLGRLELLERRKAKGPPQQNVTSLHVATPVDLGNCKHPALQLNQILA